MWHFPVYSTPYRYTLTSPLVLPPLLYSQKTLIPVSSSTIFISLLNILTDTFCPNTPIQYGDQIQLTLDGYDNSTDPSEVYATINGHEYAFFHFFHFFLFFRFFSFASFLSLPAIINFGLVFAPARTHHSRVTMSKIQYTD